MLEMAENLAIDKALRIGFKNIQLFKGEVLGIGSYGIVCKAKGDDLLCAAKCLHPGSFDPSEQENIAHNEALVKRIRRFEREIELLKEIRHPNIVLYLCLHEDTETGLPVILMELMDKNLTQFLESGSPETNLYHIHVDICHDIALALSFLHSNDIIHRDLSSNNVLLISHYRAKISDFGMAGLNLKKQTALSRNPGTDVYMPPEALKRNPDYNEKMDCFSFGVLVIQILTRKFPEPDSSFEEVDNVCRRISEEQRRQNHISQINPTHLLLPLSIKCLSNQDTDRPSAQQICEAISELKESTQYTESKKVIEKQSLPELNNGDAQIHDLQLLERPVHEGWPGVDAGIGQLGAGLEDNKIQLKWTISDEKIRLKWNNAVIDDDVIYYRVGKEIHAHRVYGISNRWIPLAGNCPHTNCPIVIINNQLTTIGGLPLTNKLFGLKIDHHPMSWSERYPPMLTRRQRASALCTNNELIVAGGMGENMSVLTVVEVMKLDTPQWSTAANLREPTYGASIAMCLDRIFILGGDNNDWQSSKSVYMCSLSSLLKSCSLRSSKNVVWNKITNLPAMQSTCVTYQDRLLAVGGRELTTAAASASTTAVSTVYTYNHATNSWKIISEMIIPRSKCFAAVLPNNHVIVVGGESQPRTQIDVIEIATPMN